MEESIPQKNKTIDNQKGMYPDTLCSEYITVVIYSESVDNNKSKEKVVICWIEKNWIVEFKSLYFINKTDNKERGFLENWQ